MTDSICEGAPISLSYTGNAGTAAQYFWSVPTALSATPLQGPGPFTFNGVAPGSYTVTLDSVIANGCTQRTGQSLTVVVSAEPQAISSASIISGNAPLEVVLNAATQPGAGYSWTLGDGSTAPGAPVTHLYTQPGDYEVVLSAQLNGCVANDTLTIRVLQPNIFIPNMFSPNDDGTNDDFRIFGLTGVAFFTLNLYDRWGTEIYMNANQPLEFWDGNTQSGEACPKGVYVYVLEYQITTGSEPITRAGSITLLR